jgi:hypothetical protein
LNPFGFTANPFSNGSSSQASFSNNKLKNFGKNIPGMSLLQQTLVQNQHSIEKLVKEISDKNNNNTSASLAPIEKEEKVQEVEISK